MSFTLVNDGSTGNWSSNTFSYTFPSGAPSAGQLDVIGINMFSGTLTVPSGWTLGRSTTTTAGGTCNQYLIYKVAGASDPSSVSLVNSISGGGAVLCWARFSATGAITADSTSGGTPTATNGTNAAATPAVSLPLAGSGELSLAYGGGFNGSGISGLAWATGYSTTASGSDGFNGVSNALGSDLSASGTQAATLSWTSGNLEAQFMHALAFISGGGTAHTATAALTVTPSFSASRVRGKYRTGSLAVTPALAVSRSHGQHRTGSLAVTPALSASRVRGTYRTGSLAVSPSFSAARTRGKYRTAALTVAPSAAAARVRGHYRTGSLTAVPSFSASRARGRYRTALLTVAPSFSAARTRGKYRTGSLAVIPSFAASRMRGKYRTGSLTVTPAFQAVPSGGIVTPAVLFSVLAARRRWTAGPARNM